MHPSTSFAPMSMVSISTWPGWERRNASASPNWVPVVYEQPGPLMTEAVVAPPHPKFSNWSPG